MSSTRSVTGCGGHMYFVGCDVGYLLQDVCVYLWYICICRAQYDIRGKVHLVEGFETLLAVTMAGLRTGLI